jgi:urease accessory protein
MCQLKGVEEVVADAYDQKMRNDNWLLSVLPSECLFLRSTIVPRIFDTIVGHAGDEPYATAIHELGHAGKVEYLAIKPEEVARRRFRLVTDKGTDCAIALGRGEQILDGSVLHCDEELAIVVQLSERRWLSLDTPDKASAMELGYLCGNLHWKVRFEGGLIHVALEGPTQAYLDRLELMLQDRRVMIVGDSA